MHPLGLGRDLDEVLDHAGGALASLVDARILLTGATGPVGRWGLEALAWARDRNRGSGELLVLTRRPGAFRAAVPHLAGHPAVTVVAGDARSYLPPDGSLDFVVAGAVPRGAPSAEVADVIVEGTRRALELCSYHGARLVLVGSGAARAATGVHERAERQAETDAATSGVDYVAARLGAAVGPRLAIERSTVGRFLADALAGGPVRVAGAGTAIRSYLYAADLAAWLWTIAARGQDGVVYDVGSPEAVTAAELAWRVARLGGDGRVLVEGGVPADPPEAPLPDTTAAEELHLAAWTGLDDALDRTWRWLSGGAARAA